MEERIVNELFQTEPYIYEHFQEETDEFLFYDIRREILYSYQKKEQGWEQVFVLTNCLKRWMECIHEADGTAVESFLTEIRKGAKKADFVCRFVSESGYSWYYTCLVTVDDPEEKYGAKGSYAIGYRRDLILGSDSATSLYHNAMDYLTRVYKKELFKSRIDECLNKYQGQKGAFCILDLDNFQVINDKFGYKVGDELLQNLAKVIRENISTADYVGRYFCDVFLIYMGDVVGENLWKQKLSNIMYKIRQQYRNSKLYNYVSIHAGVALYPRDGQTYEALLEKAKEAWTYEKITQSGGIEIYKEGMLRRKWDRRILEDAEQRVSWEAFQEFMKNSPLVELTGDLFHSVINIESDILNLLGRIGKRYQLLTVHIYELLKENKSICCTYEWCKEEWASNIMNVQGISDDNIANKFGRAQQNGTMQVFEQGEHLFGYQKREVEELPQLKNGIYIELLGKEQYIGRLVLMDFNQKHIWTKQEMQELEWFGKLFSALFQIGFREDIKDLHYANRELVDPLTRLYRVDIFLENLHKLLRDQGEKEYLLVYSDISNFKYVNETFGYDVGDSILKSWANILMEDIPSNVFAGRVCYDHFIAVREVEKGATEEELLKQLNETKRLVEHKLREEYKGSNITLNTGAFLLNEELPDLSAALAYANMARKMSKRGGTRCVLYTDTMRRVANKEMELVASLEDAIKNHEFVVYLQPKVGCSDDKVIGAEALVRWVKNGKMIFPDAFIGVFEKYGGIVELDYYVYEEMFRFIRKRMDEGKTLIPISLNVSRAHMVNTDLIDKIEELLEKYKIPTSAIEFEITESLYLEKLPGLDAVLAYFRQRGFAISMDDFGTGYSSLNAISALPIDVIKMDKIFMKRTGLDKNDKIIITHIISMANELQKRVLCEGVETDEQKAFIGSVGCDSWQGYLFSKPVSIPEFEEIVSNVEVRPVDEKK